MSKLHCKNSLLCYHMGEKSCNHHWNGTSVECGEISVFRSLFHWHILDIENGCTNSVFNRCYQWQQEPCYHLSNVTLDQPSYIYLYSSVLNWIGSNYIMVKSQGSYFIFSGELYSRLPKCVQENKDHLGLKVILQCYFLMNVHLIQIRIPTCNQRARNSMSSAFQLFHIIFRMLSLKIQDFLEASYENKFQRSVTRNLLMNITIHTKK